VDLRLTTTGSKSSETAGFVFALGSAAAYGTNIVSAQIAGTVGLSGPLLVAYRVLLLLALTLVFALATGDRLRIAAEERRPLLLFGLSSACVGSAYLSSVAFVPVTIAAVVFYTFPILIVLAEPFVAGRRLGIGRKLIALAAFAGVTLVIGPDIAGLDPRGLVLAGIASAGAAMQFFAANAMPRTSLPSKLIWSQIIILPVTVLILAATDGFRPPSALLAAPLAVTITLIGFLIGFVLQMVALTRISPGSAGIAFCAEPLFAAAVAAMVLGEKIGWLQYLGAMLVIGAIVTNVSLEKRNARTQP
jgi:drug/metabolite transporter (DMT)-like permease